MKRNTIKRDGLISTRRTCLFGLVVMATGIVVASLAIAGEVSAASQPITIVTYDISETPPSGWGGWAHSYNGRITDSRRTTGANCSAGGTPIVSYTGGVGTLNDSVTDAANIDSTHLLCLDIAADGQLVRPVITLNFANTVLIDRIVVHGGGTGGNIYPGTVAAATLTVQGTAATLTSTPAGLANDVGVPRDDVFDLTSAGLSQLATNQIAISDLRSDFFGFPLGQTAIAEISVEGRVASEPVGLDIRPASPRNDINLDARLPVPFALVSSPTVDASTIVVESIRFGHTGDEDSVSGCILVDLNRDRRKDLLCLASIAKSGFELSDGEGIATAQTTNGTQLIGHDAIQVRT
jgi:hypothetical protein